MHYLTAAGLLSEVDFVRAQSVATETSQPIDVALLHLGLIGEPQLVEAVSQLCKLPVFEAPHVPQEPVEADVLEPRFLHHNRLLPMSVDTEKTILAMVDPADHRSIEAMQFALGRPVEVGVIAPSVFEAAFSRLYGEIGNSDALDGESSSDHDDLARLQDGASEAPVVRWVNQMIGRAVEAQASDIHLEPTLSGLRVRVRLDGVLEDRASPPAGMSAPIISRIKIMARLNIAERRLAQDGRIRQAVKGKDVDFRVSTTPTIHGESVVLRILDRGSVDLKLETLGYEGSSLKRLRHMLKRPHGIVLATGPTGSGKTTSLYAALTELNVPDRKILTVEDPVEYQLAGINQVQVQPQIGRSFASTLRSFLRQDPDIMMVGEIRDLETAQIAVQAALTGHLILSTLHTNDAASAITRLLDMGVEDFLLTSTLEGVLAQRLVRRLCGACKESYAPTVSQRARLKLTSDQKLYRAKGCAACKQSGYSGRISIVEVLEMDETLRELVMARASASQIRAAAIASGMRPLFDDGVAKVCAGVTTMDEVLRVTEEV